MKQNENLKRLVLWDVTNWVLKKMESRRFFFTIKNWFINNQISAVGVAKYCVSEVTKWKGEQTSSKKL